MGRSRYVCHVVAGLALSLVAAGCGSGAKAVVAPDEPAPAGRAVLQGSIVGAGFSASATTSVSALSSGGGVFVSVVGTSARTEVDEEGRFVLDRLPSGTVALAFEGAGTSARLEIEGLVDGQVLTVTVALSGSGARVTGTPNCSPAAETQLTGRLESTNGTRLVVGGRTVDASEVRKVWRGDRRIQLADLEVGEKVKVWGTLRGDGVVAAEEIVALTSGTAPGGDTWVSFKGTVQSVVFDAFDALDVHQDCIPVLVVSGRKVKTDGSTKLKWSDGTALDPGQIAVGDHAYVEGWSKAQGYVAATKVVVDRR
jgi:hypothetical protein